LLNSCPGAGNRSTPAAPPPEPAPSPSAYANAWNPQREEVRSAVNSWVREGGAFEAVADFDKALRDPERPTQMLTKYDCGDGLHPSDLGYNKMGDAIDLSLFD
jgi:lysophospholipase L1-like esterase